MCQYCHQGRPDDVLGFEAVALAAPGASQMTLASLAAEGLLTHPPEGPLRVPGDPVERDALGWLHMSCGTSCHNAGGPAAASGFLTRLDVASLGAVSSTDAFKTGWNVASRYSIPGEARTYRLAACDEAASAAYYRAARRDGVGGTPAGTQMPPVDTHRVDPEGLAELAAWIDERCDAGGMDTGGMDAAEASSAARDAGDASPFDATVRDGSAGDAPSSADSPTADAGIEAGIDGAALDGAPTCTGATPVELTVINTLVWCSVSIAGGAASPAAQQTVCVAPGVVDLSASPLPGFELGPTPWHGTSGDHGAGDPGMVMGDVDSTTVDVTHGLACVWVCCPFTDGTGCPTTPQCPWAPDE